jgi:hypothetical protein
MQAGPDAEVSVIFLLIEGLLDVSFDFYLTQVHKIIILGLVTDTALRGNLLVFV